MSEVIIVRAIETCSACPSQWDAWDLDGNYWYLRHRHSRGAAWRYPSPDLNTWDDSPPRMSYAVDWDLEQPSEEIGDGYISLAEFCRRTGLNLALGFSGAGMMPTQPPPLRRQLPQQPSATAT